WGEWTDWGECDDEGLQHRSCRCGEEREADASLCQRNLTQSRPCQPHEVPVILPGQENQSCGTPTPQLHQNCTVLSVSTVQFWCTVLSVSPASEFPDRVC
ncbi:hypothetical protein CHARACLAT_031140, partial [Characodon lateralis]|nr:hypothetical protein [Characodon lateralis]